MKISVRKIRIEKSLHDQQFYEDFFEDVTYGQFRLAIKAQTAHEKIGKVDYMIYFNKSYYFNQAKDKVFEDGEIIFKNDAGGIIKYNK